MNLFLTAAYDFQADKTVYTLSDIQGAPTISTAFINSVVGYPAAALGLVHFEDGNTVDREGVAERVKKVLVKYANVIFADLAKNNVQQVYNTEIEIKNGKIRLVEQAPKKG